MRPWTTALIATLAVFTSGTGLAQSKKPSGDRLVARLSYISTYAVDWTYQEGSPKVCFALYRSGYYQILRDTENGTAFLQGTLSRDQLLRVGRMLKNLDFQASEGSAIRRGSESF